MRTSGIPRFAVVLFFILYTSWTVKLFVNSFKVFKESKRLNKDIKEIEKIKEKISYMRNKRNKLEKELGKEKLPDAEYMLKVFTEIAKSKGITGIEIRPAGSKTRNYLKIEKFNFEIEGNYHVFGFLISELYNKYPFTYIKEFYIIPKRKILKMSGFMEIMCYERRK